MNANPAFAASVAPALAESGSSAPGRTAATSLETFEVYRVSLGACRGCASILPSLSAVLRDQLLRASSSVVLNVADGGVFLKLDERLHEAVQTEASTEMRRAAEEERRLHAWIPNPRLKPGELELALAQLVRYTKESCQKLRLR